MLKLQIELRWIANEAQRRMRRGERRELAILHAVEQQMWMEEYDSPKFRDFLNKAA
jgi:hypothetical protein